MDFREGSIIILLYRVRVSKGLPDDLAGQDVWHPGMYREVIAGKRQKVIESQNISACGWAERDGLWQKRQQWR